MLALSMLSWWYQKGWATVFYSFKKRTNYVLSTFSVLTLIRTLFSPWRRIISFPGQSIRAHIYAGMDNLISRVMGFFVRLLVLIGALVVLVFVSLLTLIQMIVWPFIPPAFITFMILGVAKL